MRRSCCAAAAAHRTRSLAPPRPSCTSAGRADPISSTRLIGRKPPVSAGLFSFAVRTASGAAGASTARTAVDRFDEVLDDGSQAILDDLTKLTHANMSDEIDLFVDAIERDLVLPEDF